MKAKALIISCGIVALLIFGGYLYNQNQKINDLQQSLVSQQNTKQLAQTANGYTETRSSKNYNEDAEIANKAANELRVRQKGYRDHWIDHVTIKPAEFSTRGIGGIFDLEISVLNTFDVPIDELTATVYYLKANKEVHKEENIIFRNIPAGGTLKVRAPESSRGVDVDVNLKTITVKSLDFCFPGNDQNNYDPYYCKQ